MENFYMILPSNLDSKDYFPNNTIANYRTRIPQRISLEGIWEVALVEMSYTYSWYNVPEDVELMLVGINSHGVTFAEVTYLPSAQYKSLRELADALNTRFATFNAAKPPMCASYGSKLVIRNGLDEQGRLLFLKLKKDFADMLGIDVDANEKLAMQYFASLKRGETIKKLGNELMMQTSDLADLSRGVHTLFLYSDIIKPTFVGNTYSQILRVVEIPPSAKFGDQVNIKYPSAYYIPLLSNEFENIELHLKDDSGDDIPFRFGRAIATLHFRKANKNNDLQSFTH